MLGPYAQQGDAELPAAIDRAAGVTGLGCLSGLNNDGEGVAGLDSGGPGRAGTSRCTRAFADAE